ncbi:anthrone oxygenase family protein [Deinococcus piscis]|nr:anthrone oxygenase family protein [Deinococcus piscis]
MAGTFFGFSSFIMPALQRLPSHQGVASMQSINLVVLKSSFMPVFMGTALVSAVLLVVLARSWRESGVLFVLIGSSLYLVGVFGVTVAVNVPLNEALARVTLGRTEPDGEWVRFLEGWLPANHLRAAAGGVAASLLIYGVWRSHS